MDTNFLNDVIEERITKNINKLHKKKEWKNKDTEYRNIYDFLFNTLNTNTCEQLERMMYLKLELLSDEIYIAYKTGFIDGIKLNEQLGNSRK
jgi:hypothetical protein